MKGNFIYLNFFLFLLVSFASASNDICVDSDGGEDFYNKGTVSGLTLGPGLEHIDNTWTDFCGVAGEEKWMLVEFVCSDNEYERVLYNCSNGCVGGICSETRIELKCEDSDGGENIYEKGEVVILGADDVSGSDYCISREGFPNPLNSCDENCGVMELYCSEKTVGMEVISAMGYDCSGACKDGACVKEDEGDTCVDSDPENLAYVAGNASLEGSIYRDRCVRAVSLDSGSAGDDFVDSCSGEWCFLKESKCVSGRQVYSDKVVCDTYCEKGACSEPTSLEFDYLFQRAEDYSKEGEYLQYYLNVRPIHESIDHSEIYITVVFEEFIEGKYVKSSSLRSNYPSEFTEEFHFSEETNSYSVWSVPNWQFEKYDALKIVLRAGDSEIRNWRVYLDDFDWVSTKEFEFSSSRDLEEIDFAKPRYIDTPVVPEEKKIDDEEIANDLEESKNETVDSSQTCNGCLVNGKCYIIGYREADEYCNNMQEKVAQVDSGSACENSFECKSNLCIDSECISEGFFKRIMNWFKKFFG